MGLGEEVFAEAAGEVIGQVVLPVFKEIASAIKGAFKSVRMAVAERTLTYEEAMRYFVEHKGDSPRIAKGAMLREKDADGKVIVIQCFLDKENNLIVDETGAPLGSVVKVTALDAELLNTFKDKNIIIIE
jgi:hypothetical protein